MIDLRIYLGHQYSLYISQFSDFCVTTRRLFDGETSYLEYNFHVTQILT